MVEFKGTGGRGGEERKPRPDWSSCPVVSKLQDFTLNIRTYKSGQGLKIHRFVFLILDYTFYFLCFVFKAESKSGYQQKGTFWEHSPSCSSEYR